MNAATIVILLVLCGMVALIIRSLIRDRKKGKACACCSGGCSGCSGCCHGK